MDVVTHLRVLRELITALEQRLPHVERAGEAAIAHEAAALKAKALERIAELERELASSAKADVTSGAARDPRSRA
jgi:hypothetical protein